MLQARRAALAEMAADKSARAANIAGAGPAFCAGHDLRELRASAYDAAYVEPLFAECAEVMQRRATAGAGPDVVRLPVGLETADNPSFAILTERCAV